MRLPGSWTGIEGEIADTFNEIVAANKHMAHTSSNRRIPSGVRHSDYITMGWFFVFQRVNGDGSLSDLLGRGLAALEIARPDQHSENRLPQVPLPPETSLIGPGDQGKRLLF